MAFFTEIDEQAAVLRGMLGEDASATDLAEIMTTLSDDKLVQVLTAAASLARCAERITVIGAGIAAARSDKDAGHSGLAQSRGHRKPADFVQELTGTSRSEAAKHIRVGRALLESTRPVQEMMPSDPGAVIPDAPTRAWHEAAGAALLKGSLSSTQHDAILRGLGEPPIAIGLTDADERRRVDAALWEAWSLATEQLVVEARHRTVEELRIAARTIRDRLDPEGAERRFLERHAARSFRMWTDQDGRHHGALIFDDEGYLWVKTITDAALRPRRGGPRFVDEDEKAAAGELVDDPRTNDQLAYDLLLDLLSTGSVADAAGVFGVKQAGLRIVHVVDDQTANDASRPSLPTGATHSEDGLIALPDAAAEQLLCNTGHTNVTLDGSGNPLDVGREHRLFTPKQRVALAVRDGGCRWKGCDRAASYCEAHHIDHWAADHGRTDIDRGILLCRFHHMQLHHAHWWITRDGTGDFVLHHPTGASFGLERRLVLARAWAGIDPPLRRFHPPPRAA